MKFEEATHPATFWKLFRIGPSHDAGAHGSCQAARPSGSPWRDEGAQGVAGHVESLSSFLVPFPRKTTKASSGKGWEGVKEALPKTNQTPNGSITQTKDWVSLG